MQFRQKKDGSCTIEFSDKELEIIARKKHIYFTADALKDFGNALMRMVAEWQENFSDDVRYRQTSSDAKALEGQETDDKD